MIIVLATDDNFVQHCCVAMTSVLLHNSNVHFYILTEGLQSEHERVLTEHIESLGGKITIVNIGSDIVKQFPMPANAPKHISIATYYRLLCTLVLPETIDKIIYMDCDMAVRGSLAELWNEDIDKYAIGAVFQSCNSGQRADKLRLGIPEKFGYFNAGLLLVNLSYWRKNNIIGQLFAYIKYRYMDIIYHDQDVLNGVLFDKVKVLGFKWNYLPIFFQFEPNSFQSYLGYNKVENPIVIHYVSSPKPWDFGCTHPYKREYYDILQQTPFKEFKPKFNLSKFMRDIVKVNMIRFIGFIDVFDLRKKVKCFLKVC